MGHDLSFCPSTLHDVDDPDESDLHHVPRVFQHAACGGQTHLPARAVRLYLRDPFRLVGAGNSVWCAGCRKNVPAADCRWSETDQNVREYYRLLIGEALRKSPFAWCGRFLLFGLIGVGVIVALVPLAYLKQGGSAAAALTLASWTFVVAAGVLLLVFLWSAWLYRNCGQEYDRFLAESRRRN